jgi:hypothetical protein
MSDTPSASRVTLLTLRGDVRERTELSTHELHFVSEDPTDDLFPSLSFQWSGKDFTGYIRDALASVAHTEPATNERYQHSLTVGAGRPQTWNSAMEAPAMRRVREVLQCAGGLRLAEAKKELLAGEAAIEAGAHAKALAHLTRGLRVLGNLYWEPESLDNSGQRLVAALAEQLAGRPENAAAIQRKVLESRTKLYEARNLPH